MLNAIFVIAFMPVGQPSGQPTGKTDEDRIYFQFGHGQSDDADRHPGCSLMMTHVPTMRLRLSMHPEVKIRLIDAHVILAMISRCDDQAHKKLIISFVNNFLLFF